MVAAASQSPRERRGQHQKLNFDPWTCSAGSEQNGFLVFIYYFYFVLFQLGPRAYRAIPGERREEEKRRPQVVTKAQSEEQER